MRSVTGVIDLVQEGRFRLSAEDGRVLAFVLSHRASAEPQDLPPLQRAGRRVRVDYGDSSHLIGAVAHRIMTEE